MPNLQKMQVAAVDCNSNALTATVTVIVYGTGNVVYGTYFLVIQDGTSQGLRATAAPLGYADRVEIFTLATPTGFTDLMTAYTGNIAARNRAAETALITAGLLPPGVVS